MPNRQPPALPLTHHHTRSPDQDDLKYMACGCVHIKTAVYAIAVLDSLQIFLEILNILGLRGRYNNVDYTQFCLAAITVLCLVALFVGLKKNKKYLLVPFFVWQCISCLLYAYHACVLVDLRRQDPVIWSKTSSRLVYLILSACVAAWWAYLVYRCYRYMKDLEKMEHPHPAPASRWPCFHVEWTCRTTTTTRSEQRI